MSGMRAPEPKTALRWAAPAAFVLVVGGTGLIASTATAEPHLPPATPEQLLVDLQNVKVDNMSGTVEEEANLGIPAIPGASGSDSSDFNSLVSGSHTFGLWYAAPNKGRVALYGRLGESDIITNGTDRWTWSSKDNKVTHTKVPADAAGQTREPQSKPSDLPKTPQEAAQRVLKAIGPTTKITTDSAVTVAGRPSYELVVRPNEAGSLVTEARLAVDGETHLPLRVEVFAGTNKVFGVGFTKIDFAKPADKYFNCTPPKGAEVTEVKPDTTKTPSKKPSTAKPKATDANAPKIVGEGWTTVVISKVPPATASGSPTGRKSGSTDQLEQILRQLPHVSGNWGSGRLLAGTAFSAVLTDDGRLAVGSVTPDVLYAALKK
jgi:outer membrane lipoprotein-sorting protein